MAVDGDIQAPGANPENLLALIRAGWESRVVVPDFQRQFVWPRESVEELLESILNRYFVGTLLVLDTPAHNPMFPPRSFDGVSELGGPPPPTAGTLRLILDGQQRLTSLFYAMYEPPIPLRGTSNPYRFFVRLEPAMAGEMDDAVVGVSTAWTRGIRNLEEEVAGRRALPLPVLADHRKFFPWLYSESSWDDESREKLTVLHRRFNDFMIPVVSLVPETGADNIVNIFERVNRTGIDLSLFDLMAARMYVKGLTEPTLHDLWRDFQNEQPQLATQISGETILRLITLLEGKELKKAALLGLDALGEDNFRRSWENATQAMTAAWERVRIEYGAYEPRLIPYGTMLVPMAAMLHHLRAEKRPQIAYRRLDTWYWTSVFAQRYESGVNTRSVADVQEVLKWCDGGEAPAWVGILDLGDIPFSSDSPRSAIYRGVLCLTALAGARDFCTGENIALHECQDDHIFPSAVYGGSYPVDGVLNHAFIAKKCNNWKRARKPSEFFAHCLAGHGGDRAALLSTLSSHLISERAVDSLLRDDFHAFVACRESGVRNAIQQRIASG